MAFQPNKAPMTIDALRDLEIANLNVLNFGALESGDSSEAALLLKSCIDDGFFYLDFGGETGRVLDDVQGIYSFMKEYFRQPLEVKMKDYSGGGQWGFKGIGEYVGADPAKRDGYQALRLAQTDFLQNRAGLPQLVKDDLGLFDSFLSLSQHITLTIVKRLSEALSLEGSARFETHHDPNKSNSSALVMMEFNPAPGAGRYGHNEHTDIGTLTLLFNNQWGLQVNCGGTYKYVRPSERHAIVNVGDCLRFISGNKLKSVLHRVAPPALTHPRSSFGYFLRPNDAAIIDTPDGTQISAQGWTEKKYVIHQSSLETEAEKDMLTGWMETPKGRPATVAA